MSFEPQHPLSIGGGIGGGAYERWNRIALGTLCIGVVLIAAAVYGVSDGDDLYGVANTLIPAALCLGMWRFAVWRRDR